MVDRSDPLFDSVDALLAVVAAGQVLPVPAERVRLREAAGLTSAAVAQVLKTRPATVEAWEAGRTEPAGDRREAYRRLLDGLAAHYPPPAAPAETPPAAAPAVTVPPAEVVPPVEAAAAEAPAPAEPEAQHPPATREPGSAPRGSAPVGDDGRGFANGPLLVLDGDGTAYGVGGLVLECPAKTVAALVEWTLQHAQVGAPRLHRAGRDSDPLVVLTAAAASRLGLPSELEDRRGLRLPENHPVVTQIAKAEWQLTRRGFGPWPRIYRPAADGRRACVQLAVLPWGALDNRAWANAETLPPPELARVLGDYAARVITPRGSTAVSGLELMTALRPPTRAVRGEDGVWVSGPVPGSLTVAVDPAPPEAPDEHPVAVGRAADEALDEEAFEWIRDPEQLTDAECAQPFAVGIDVNMAFAAAANRLVVGLGAPVHVRQPAFDKALPGSWFVDLSGLAFDPRLPNPFTPHGVRPVGPAWYATPTVAYAAELGHQVRPLEAWLRPEHGPYLDPWYQRLRDAYLATMAELGVSAGMPPAEYLAAMEQHKKADPGRAAVLSAVKATVKGGIGKLRERPQGARHAPGERWGALERPTWRPDIRAAVISAARVNMHRKMLALAAKADLWPIAVLSDCAVYPSSGPGPLDFLPSTPDGRPLPGGFRLGVSPGMVKHEGTQEFLWAAQLLDQGHNPARHIKGADAAIDGE
ncbi:telomere-associated protein Tap [Streptacidiphilus cavernicola]|uniref:Helix-turn-helix domain-containing protein n=1 Tax=Streptacidiphilus cavernicola TaxID=3342716 RepID=A0ABV6VQ16_9ACTN